MLPFIFKGILYLLESYEQGANFRLLIQRRDSNSGAEVLTLHRIKIFVEYASIAW